MMSKETPSNNTENEVTKLTLHQERHGIATQILEHLCDEKMDETDIEHWVEAVRLSSMTQQEYSDKEKLHDFLVGDHNNNDEVSENANLISVGYDDTRHSFSKHPLRILPFVLFLMGSVACLILGLPKLIALLFFLLVLGYALKQKIRGTMLSDVFSDTDGQLWFLQGRMLKPIDWEKITTLEVAAKRNIREQNKLTNLRIKLCHEDGTTYQLGGHAPLKSEKDSLQPDSTLQTLENTLIQHARNQSLHIEEKKSGWVAKHK